MNRRLLLGGLLLGLCLATLWGVWDQRSELAGLRSEQQQLLAQVTARAGTPAPVLASEAAESHPEATTETLVATPELLRLRGEVTRLTERRRELEGIQAENERLRTQLASRATNALAGSQPPPGYILTREARMMGFNTPEDTLQSMLWAIRNRDLTNLLQVFTPETAQQIEGTIIHANRTVEEFFGEAAAYPGARIVKRREDPNTSSLEVDVEIVPNLPAAQMNFRQINGQWKIAKPF